MVETTSLTNCLLKHYFYLSVSIVWWVHGIYNCHTADQTCTMIYFLADNFFAKFWERLLEFPVLLSYENELSDNLVRSGHRDIAKSSLLQA